MSKNSARAEAVKGSPWDHKFTKADEAIIGRVEEIAKKEGWPMAQVAIAWINTKVTSPIVGFNSVCDGLYAMTIGELMSLQTD